MNEVEDKLKAIAKLQEKLADYPGNVLREFLSWNISVSKTLEKPQIVKIGISNRDKTLFKDFDDEITLLMNMFAKVSPDEKTRITNEYELLRLDENELNGLAENLRTYDEFCDFIKEQDEFADNVVIPGTVLLSKGGNFYLIKDTVRKSTANPMHWQVKCAVYVKYVHEDDTSDIIVMNNEYAHFASICGSQPVTVDEFKKCIMDDIDKEYRQVEEEAKRMRLEVDEKRDKLNADVSAMTELTNKWK